MKHNLFGTIIPDEIIDRMEKATDQMQEGRKIAIEIMEAFAETPGVAGVHIMAPNHEEAIPEVISAFGRRQRATRGRAPEPASTPAPATGQFSYLG
jgi:methylenetetrahydrofolate reductase (NADPH)